MTLLLLSSSLVLAHDFNFTDHYEITSQTSTEILSRVKSYHNGTQWWTTYQLGGASSNNRHFARSNNDFTLLGTDGTSCGISGAFECALSDCNIREGVNEVIYSCIGSTAEHAGFWYGRIFNYTLSTSGFTEIDSSTDGSNRIGEEIGVAQDVNLMAWLRNGAVDTDPRYTTTGEIGAGGNFEGEGTIDFPTTYHTPSDIQVVSCGGAYHFIINKNGLFDLVFDYSLSYQDIYALNPTGHSVGTLDYGVWVDEEEQDLYVVSVNDTGGASDDGLVYIQAWSCDESYELSSIYQKQYDQSEFNSTANFTANRYMMTPYLTMDSNGVFNLFYQWRDDSNYNVKASVDYGDCTCGDWIAQDDCSGTYQKHTRVCYPTGCEDNTTYWEETDYCGILYNESLGIYNQQTELYVYQTQCETDWENVGEGTVSCSPNPIQIPAGCTAPNVTLEAVPLFDGSACANGNYHLTTCNPSHDCFNQNYSCQQLNVSQQDLYTAYISGQYATGKATLSVDNLCKCHWLFWNYGLTQFKLVASLNLVCAVPCVEEWVCINEDYTALKRVDCSQTNVTYCQYGCDETSGECHTLTGEGDSSQSTYRYTRANWWWETFITNPSKTMRFFYALGGSGLMGVILIFILKGLGLKDETLGVVFLIGFGLGFAFFVLLGWIPVVIIIVVIFFVLVGAYVKITK